MKFYNLLIVDNVKGINLYWKKKIKISIQIIFLNLWWILSKLLCEQVLGMCLV